ncbi:MAG: hypothetical protein AB7T15_06610 [Desulfuromonas sp.]|jgi:hypothetical protein
MSPSEQHFVSCQRCGRQIEEQCAIEEDGLLLCGDCVVAQTKREVDQAEAASTKLRQQQREQQLHEIRRQQGQRAVLLLLLALAGLLLAQWVTHSNRPEPVASQKFVPTENLTTTQAFLVLALHQYRQDHAERLPERLDQLVPCYLTEDYRPILPRFRYQPLATGGYLLELAAIPADDREEPIADEPARGEAQ